MLHLLKYFQPFLCYRVLNIIFYLPALLVFLQMLNDVEGGAAVDCSNAYHEVKNFGDSEQFSYFLCHLVGNLTMRFGAVTFCGRVGCCSCPCCFTSTMLCSGRIGH